LTIYLFKNYLLGTSHAALKEKRPEGAPSSVTEQRNRANSCDVRANMEEVEM
jgi:hypothetical protein